MTNLGVELALNEIGIEFERAKVGDRYVMERLLANNWVLGGEGSGHMVIRDCTSTGDGIVSALQVLLSVWKSGKNPCGSAEGDEQAPPENDQRSGGAAFRSVQS